MTAPPEPDEAAVEALAGDDVIRLGQVIGCEWISEWDERDDSTFTMCDRHNEVWPCVPGKILAHGYVAPDDHARQVRDARQEGAEAALAELYDAVTEMRDLSGDNTRRAAMQQVLDKIARAEAALVTDWQAADDA